MDELKAMQPSHQAGLARFGDDGFAASSNVNTLDGVIGVYITGVCEAGVRALMLIVVHGVVPGVMCGTGDGDVTL